MSEPATPTESAAPRLAPLLRMRLAWWFGIYLSAQIAIVFRLGFTMDAIGTIIFFPVCLVWGEEEPLASVPYGTPAFTVAYFFAVSLPFLVYLFHLYATLKVKSRQRFDLLMLALVGIVLLNQYLTAYWSYRDSG